MLPPSLPLSPAARGPRVNAALSPLACVAGARFLCLLNTTTLRPTNHLPTDDGFRHFLVHRSLILTVHCPPHTAKNTSTTERSRPSFFIDTSFSPRSSHTLIPRPSHRLLSGPVVTRVIFCHPYRINKPTDPQLTTTVTGPKPHPRARTNFESLPIPTCGSAVSTITMVVSWLSR